MSHDQNSTPSFLKADEQDKSQLPKNALGDFASFLIILQYAKSHRLAFFLSLVILIFSAVFSLLSARMMGELVEKGLLNRDVHLTIYFVVAIVSFELFALLMSWFGSRWLAKTSSKTILSIREKLFTHIQKLPMTYFDRSPQGRVVTRLTHDVEGLEKFFTSSLGRLGQSFFMAIIAAMAMLWTHFYLGALLILSMIPAIAFIHFTRYHVRDLFREISKFSSAVNARLSEFISGIDVIRSFGVEKWSKNRYDHTIDQHLEANLKSNTFFAWSRPLISLMMVLPLFALVWIGGHQVMAGALSVGLFVTFVRYYDRFYMPLLTLAREIHVIQQAFTSAERVASFLRESDEDSYFIRLSHDVDEDKSQRVGETDCDLIFDDVWMSYDDKNWVLKGISFEILPGQKVGLVGKTGHGKTTLVSLLTRLYDFQRGEIYFKGKNIRDFAPSEIRQRIGMVTQDSVIFKGTLRQNLTLSQDQDHQKVIEEQKIREACRLTGLLQVMHDQKMTMDDYLLEDGANLSVGQKQLISITRVLLSDPEILILDEATANVDPYYEELIQNAMHILMEGRSCLMIAHRLDTLSLCDKILVFSHGQLVEQGAPRELLSRHDGHFRQLSSAQQSTL